MTKKKNPNIGKVEEVEVIEAAEDDAKKKLTKAIAAQKAEDKTNDLPPFYVAEGKSIVCRRRILEYPDEVKAEWLGGGVDALASLVKRKYVKKS